MTQLFLTSLRRAALAPLALGALLAASPASAAPNEGTGGSTGSSSSNNGDISIRILSIGGVNQTAAVIWLGLDACLDDAEVEFRLDEVPDRRTLDIYIGSDCNEEEARDGDSESECTLVRSEPIDNRVDDLRINIGAAELIHAAIDKTECEATDAKPELWFLAVDNTGTSEAINAMDYGRYTLDVDTDPPDAPTRIRGGTGENQIPVTWNTGREEVDSFEIFVDSGDGTGVSDASVEPAPSDEDGGTQDDDDTGSGSTAAECGTGALRAGASADSVEAFFAKREGSPTATSTDLAGSDIEGGLAAVAVVAVDEAGNKSTLSEIACVMVVPTTGWKDLVEMQEGDYPQGCPCAATGPAQLDAAWPIALALSVLAYRRRTRS